MLTRAKMHQYVFPNLKKKKKHLMILSKHDIHSHKIYQNAVVLDFQNTAQK